MRGTDFMNGGKTMVEMDAAHLMEREVVSCEADTDCQFLAEVMHKRNFGSIPIVDGHSRLIGIVSECDLLNAIIKGKALSKTPASEVMTELVVSIPEEMSAEEVCALLQARHLIRVPVVDKKGCLVGIVARRDILASYLESTLGALPHF